ncbi:hypothetical protein APA386B_358 [Acetobacter pasteurianus 386B]|nr:hypothetical protein APA386B_358 [Acetobacter pasteurianus 386B]
MQGSAKSWMVCGWQDFFSLAYLRARWRGILR